MNFTEERQEPALSNQDIPFYQQRMILKNGIKNMLVDTHDIVYCYSSNKVVYVVDAGNHKYVSDKTLQGLEAALNPRHFFRANRNEIINFHFIKSFASFEKNKLKVELKTLPKEQVVIVSQSRVATFKDWLYKQL